MDYIIQEHPSSFIPYFKVVLYLCIPHSNAILEGLFKYVKIIKTDWGSKLGEKNLGSILCIKAEDPELLKFAETFCSKAVTLYISGKHKAKKGNPSRMSIFQ